MCKLDTLLLYYLNTLCWIYIYNKHVIIYTIININSVYKLSIFKEHVSVYLIYLWYNMDIIYVYILYIIHYVLKGLNQGGHDEYKQGRDN